LRLGQFSKAEAVFVPGFEPQRFAEIDDRWRPAQMAQLDQLVSLGQLPSANIKIPADTTTLDYAQAGVRFTTTIGSSDFGAQYYYGRLTTPAVTMTAATPPVVTFAYNPYHQIGVDYAQVVAGFNLRSEFAANITEDITGDDGTVYNPHLAWSLGFDRDMVWGINLNLQCNETIRLLDGEVNSNPLLDIEADKDITSTRITAILSKKFLRDEIEIRTALMWGVEDRDFLIIPAFVWTKDSVRIELSGGIFGGDEDGQFGQFHDNGFIKAGIKYTF
jgi:hypothetical protein